MFYRRLIAGMLLASVPMTVFASGADVPDYRQNGWASPVDYRSHEGCYQFDQYKGHVGDDLCRDPGTPVVAIADGCVEDYNPTASSYGGVGVRGGVFLLRHYTDDGKVFFAVYGHNTLNQSYLADRKCGKSTIVKKGDKIAEVLVYVGGSNHLHFGIRPDAKDSGSEYRGKDCDRLDHCGWVEPFAFLMSHHPATLVPKGEQGFYQGGGDYILKGSDRCDTANARFKIIDGSRSDTWITDEVSQSEACAGIPSAIEKTIQSARNNDGVINLEEVVETKKKPWWSSWISPVVSVYHYLFGLAQTPTALAADSGVQQQLAVHRTGQVYEIQGTDKQVVIVTDGPGMNGDKAVDWHAYAELDPAETYAPSTGSNASGKRPDLVSTSLRTERSSGNEWNTIAWGDTVCLVAVIKNAGNADTPVDVKVSFFVSKGGKEDKEPHRAGYMMAKAKYLTKAKTAISTQKRCINKDEDDYPSPYPGKFNFGVHVDSDNRVAESNEKNNVRGEQAFTLTESSRLVISQFWLSNPTPQPGETVTAYVRIRNTGTPFGSDKVNTEWRIHGPEYGPDPIILGLDQTKRNHLRRNDEAGEDISFVVPTVPGIYIVLAEVDFDFRLTQSDRSGNMASLTFTIPESP